MQEKTRVITAHVPVALAKQIDVMAERMERPRGWIIKQALRQWMEKEEWKHEQILEALDQVHRGEVVDHQEVKAWIDSLKKPQRKKK